jgi:hypothetical protein
MLKTISKLIAFMLSGTILLPAIPMIHVLADENTLENFAESALSSSFEEVVEAGEDAVSSPTKASKWFVAVSLDGADWWLFHNQVQKDIRDRYRSSGIRQSELTVKYKYEKDGPLDKNGVPKYKKGDLTGGFGRADLAWQITDVVSPNFGMTYLWEIKPSSYLIDPKKTKGEQQLQGYVNTDSSYRIGNTEGVNITGGSCSAITKKALRTPLRIK